MLCRHCSYCRAPETLFSAAAAAARWLDALSVTEILDCPLTSSFLPLAFLSLFQEFFCYFLFPHNGKSARRNWTDFVFTAVGFYTCGALPYLPHLPYLHVIRLSLTDWLLSLLFNWIFHQKYTGCWCLRWFYDLYIWVYKSCFFVLF